MNLVRFADVVVAASLSCAALAAHGQVMVGGAPMYASKDIVDNASQSKEHTILVDGIRAAGLAETLKGKGPFTVFAPVDAAFRSLPAGTLDDLRKPANQAQLRKVVTHHVVVGKLDTAALAKAVEAGGGKATLTAVSGGSLVVTRRGKSFRIADEGGGGTARIRIRDVVQSNGVIHVVDKVLLPAPPGRVIPGEAKGT